MKDFLARQQMCRRVVAVVALAAFLLLAKGNGLAIEYQQSLLQNPLWQSWGKGLSDKLVGFIPNPGPGFVDRMPWDDVKEWPFVGGGGGGWFYVVNVYRRWAFADTALVREGQNAVEKRRSLQKRGRELLSQRKMDEYMKLAKEEGPKLDAEESKLKGRARYLDFEIEVNNTPETRLGAINVQPVGQLSGYPIYRTPIGSDYGTEYVRLGVYIGPKGFQNPLLDSPESTRKTSTELKTVIVMVKVSTDKEAVGRQMLEKMDYAGLAKLLGR